MRTVVYQSYRTFDVPSIISKCMPTVRDWAEKQGYEYRFFDDILFDKVPDWFKDRVHHEKLPMSDLGRLIIARELLAEGFDRVVWVDADLYVLKPGELSIPEAPYFVCKEVWVERSSTGFPVAIRKVNNAFMGFTQNQPVLDVLIEACLRHAQETKSKLPNIEFGPNLLTTLDTFLHFPRVTNVALLSPLTIVDLLQGGGPCWSIYANAFGKEYAAINLCSSYLNDPSQGVRITEAMFDKVIETLQRPLDTPTPRTGLTSARRRPSQ